MRLFLWISRAAAGILFTILAYLSQTTPESAFSNLGTWYEFASKLDAPSWLRQPWVDPLVTIVFYLLAAGSFFWFIWPYRNVEISWPRRRFPMAPIVVGEKESQPIQVKPEIVYPTFYTESEKLERYDAWSRIYKVLNTQCSEALDKASYVSNTWKEEIIIATPNGFRERMAGVVKNITASLLEIRSIYSEYEYLADIKLYFEDSWGSFQSVLYESSNILSETLKRMPENMTHNLVVLLEPQAQEYRKGVKGFGQWIGEAKIYAAERIKDLGQWPTKASPPLRSGTGAGENRDEAAFRLGYERGNFKITPGRDAAVLRLTQLRSEGVVIRNDGSGLPDTLDLDSWISQVNGWMNEVIEALTRVSAEDSEWFKTLGEVPLSRVSIPNVRLTGDLDRSLFSRTFCQHDYRLARLDGLLKKYGVGA